MEYRYDSYYEENIPYKMSYIELIERSKNNNQSYMKERDILAYIRYCGESFRCMVSSAILGSETKAKMVLCRIMTEKDDSSLSWNIYNPLIDQTFPEGSWYIAHKLSLTPVEYKGCSNTCYVSDFCSLVNEGHITLIDIDKEK